MARKQTNPGAGGAGAVRIPGLPSSSPSPSPSPSPVPSPPRSPGQTFASVYDGRTCIGFLLGRGKLGVEAFDAAEQSLGTFPDQKSAARAVYAAFDQEGVR